jgi:hypothetical protein
VKAGFASLGLGSVTRRDLGWGGKGGWGLVSGWGVGAREGRAWCPVGPTQPPAFTPDTSSTARHTWFGVGRRQNTAYQSNSRGLAWIGGSCSALLVAFT